MFSPAHFVTIELLLAASDFSTKSFRDAFFAHLVILTLIALGLSWSSKEVLVESGNSLRHTFKDAQTIGLPSSLLSAPSLGSNSLASAQSATPTPRKADITGTHPSDLSTTRFSDSSDDVATGDTGVCVRTAQPSPRSVQNLSNSVITYNSAEIQPCIQVVLVPAKPYDQSPLFPESQASDAHSTAASLGLGRSMPMSGSASVAPNYQLAREIQGKCTWIRIVRPSSVADAHLHSSTPSSSHVDSTRNVDASASALRRVSVAIKKMKALRAERLAIEMAKGAEQDERRARTRGKSLSARLR